MDKIQSVPIPSTLHCYSTVIVVYSPSLSFHLSISCCFIFPFLTNPPFCLFPLQPFTFFPPHYQCLTLTLHCSSLPLQLSSYFFHLPISPSSSSSSSVRSPFSSWQQTLQRDRMLESQRRRLSHEWQGGECLMSRVTGWLRSWSLSAGTSSVKSRSKSAPLA